MRRIAYFLTAGRSWIYLENSIEVLSVDQMGEDALGHGAAADVAVADEKYFYHYFISPCFAQKCPVLQGFLGLLWYALKLQIVANQSKIEQVVTTC